MATDAPDWQTIITLQSGGAVTDAPDWTDVVTGPGGTPPVVGGGSGDWQPQDFGWVGWTSQMWTGSSFTASSGSAFTGSLFRAATSATISHLVMYVRTSSLTLTANESYLCLYTSAAYGLSNPLTLLGNTSAGAIDSSLTTAGETYVSFPLASGVAVTAGTLYYAALLITLTGGTVSVLGSAWPSNNLAQAPVPNGVPGFWITGGVPTTKPPTSFFFGNPTTNMAASGPWMAGY
jgi:hypothetical protein